MKKKYYLVLDCETATLPFSEELCTNTKEKQKIAIAKPLVYDIGWVIIDRLGNEIKRASYLVQETFFVPNVFNTAYYKEKRPLYIEKLKNNEIIAKNWDNIMEELISDLETVDLSLAYNCCFDFKKAIPYTERYIYHLYNSDYNNWERGQKNHCTRILSGIDNDDKNEEFLKPYLKLRNKKYDIADLWGISCDRLINIDKYRNYCLDNLLLSNSKMYFKSSAETSFQYLMNEHSFIEEHTALADSIIESQILVKALKKGKIEPYIKAFPFKELGTVIDYVVEKKPKYKNAVKDELETYLETLTGNSSYRTKVENELLRIY